MAAPKIKSKTQKQEVLAEIAKLDRRGYTQHQIGAAVGLSQPVVSIYLKKIREEYKRKFLINREEAIEEKLQQYREVRQEAWAAYERSKEDVEKVTKITTPGKAPKLPKALRGPKAGMTAQDAIDRIKTIIATEGRLPANCYLDTVIKTLEAESELMGLTSPVKVNMTQLNVNLFDALMGQVPREVPDVVEQKLIEAQKEVYDVSANGHQ